MSDKFTIDNRLENWRICFKDKPQYNKTKSLEGNFKETEKRTDELGNEIEGYDAPTQSKPVLDLNDALRIERAVIKLPDKHKLVLVCNYMYPYLLTNNRFPKTCTIIGISRKAEVFDDFLKKSKTMLENILNRNH
jgi:hypothetical protein